MTRLLVDTSVVIKWWHTSGESEVAEARALRAAHVSGEIDALILDLGVYELGNVLLRSLQWPPDAVADQIDDLLAIVGTPIVMIPTLPRLAASLGHTHGLTFYDACWAASANLLQVPLVSADRALLDAGLAESATSITSRLRLLSK